jgi:hypothetical protein
MFKKQFSGFFKGLLSSFNEPSSQEKIKREREGKKKEGWGGGVLVDLAIWQYGLGNL